MPLVDRQPDAALETSFGNAAQISVSYCEPWANREAPLSPDEQQLVAHLQEAFRQIERALTAVRQYTWDHPVTSQQIAATAEVLGQVLARHPEDFVFDVKDPCDETVTNDFPSCW